MPGTTSTLSTAIREAYAPGFELTVYRNRGLLPLFAPPIDSGGDTAYRWKINTTGNNSVEIYSEGQGQLAPGNQAYVNAAVDYLAFRFMTQITGHLRAALRSRWFNAIEEEQSLGMEDMIDLINTTYMASTYGLEAAIAATGSYAGLTRGSITYFESAVTAVNDSLALSDIQDMLEGLKDNERGVTPDLLLGPVNQETNIYRLAPEAGMRTTGYENPLPNFQGQRVAGMTPAFLGDWTDTVLCYLRRSDVKVIQHQPFMVKEMAPSGDSDVMQNSYMGIIVHVNPKLAGKNTGVTA
jgi:hypothetical protein